MLFPSRELGRRGSVCISTLGHYNWRLFGWLFQQNLQTEEDQPLGCPEAPGCHQFSRWLTLLICLICWLLPGRNGFRGLRGRDVWMALSCAVDAGEESVGEEKPG